MDSQESQRFSKGAREVRLGYGHAYRRCILFPLLTRCEESRRNLLSAGWSECVYPAGLAIVCRRVSLHTSATLWTDQSRNSLDDRLGSGVSMPQ
jgi:hypothetical protein